MSRELLLIPKEKYEMILKSKEEKDPRMTTTMQKEDVPSEIQMKEPSKTINVRKTTTPKRSQRGYGFIVKKQMDLHLDFQNTVYIRQYKRRRRVCSGLNFNLHGNIYTIIINRILTHMCVGLLCFFLNLPQYPKGRVS